MYVKNPIYSCITRVSLIDYMQIDLLQFCTEHFCLTALLWLNSDLSVSRKC